MTPYYKSESGAVTLYQGDCREVLRGLAEELAGQVAVLLTDPPYGIDVESEQFEDAPVDWDQGDPTELIDEMLKAARPLMKKNGAFYVFGHPGQFFDARKRYSDAGFMPLQELVWVKTKTKTGALPNQSRANKQHPESLRTYFPETERVLFGEVMAEGGGKSAEREWALREEKEHDAKMRPLVEYMRGELAKTTLTTADVCKLMKERTGKGPICGHYFSGHQFVIPTAEMFTHLREVMNAHLKDPNVRCFYRDHENLNGQYTQLKLEWDALRRQWEALRRPHFAQERTKTDVLRYNAVALSMREGHPCEKPVDMLADLIKTSTRPGDIVLDAFAGSGATGIAAKITGRRAVLIEQDEHYLELMRRRFLNDAPLFGD